MATFRVKSPVIEAVQLRWTQWHEVCEFVGHLINPDNGGFYIEDYLVTDTCGEQGPYIGLNLVNARGETIFIKHGDWILRDSEPNTFKTLKPDEFNTQYEPYPILDLTRKC